MSLLYCEVRFGFLIPSLRATVVSSSEAGIVTIYLLRTEGPLLLSTSKLKMSIETLLPRFDVTHHGYVSLCCTRLL